MLFSVLHLGLLATLAAALPAAGPVKRVPQGFVTTNGEKFQLDGKDFYFAGSNAYYFPFSKVISRTLLPWMGACHDVLRS